MPRTGRAVLLDYPHPIIQPGHNRQVVFAEAGDFEASGVSSEPRFRAAYSPLLTVSWRRSKR